MSIQKYPVDEKVKNGVEIEHMDPTTLQDFVERSNKALVQHKDWLDAFPHNNAAPPLLPSTTHPIEALITAPPIIDLRDLDKRQIFSKSVGGIGINIGAGIDTPAAASASVAALSASAALNSANAQLAALSISADSALAALGSQVSSAQLAETSASSLLAAALAAETSASAAAAKAQASADQILSIAQSIASDASATATLALQQALATISAATMQASDKAKMMSQMTAKTFALVVVFSILGSALLTGLTYFFVSRILQRRKAAKKRATRDDFVYDVKPRPQPQRQEKAGGAEYVQEKRGMELEDGRAEVTNPFADPRPVVEVNTHSNADYNADHNADSNSLFQSFSFTGDVESRRQSNHSQPGPSSGSTLPYDPEDSSRPPRFRSWLTESFRTVSMFGNGNLRNSREERELKAKKEKEESDEIRRAAIKKLREGEDRRELERKRRVSEERRMRAREENEEVERKVSLRRMQTELENDDISIIDVEVRRWEGTKDIGSAR